MNLQIENDIKKLEQFKRSVLRNQPHTKYHHETVLRLIEMCEGYITTLTVKEAMLDFYRKVTKRLRNEKIV